MYIQNYQVSPRHMFSRLTRHVYKPHNNNVIVKWQRGILEVPEREVFKNTVSEDWALNLSQAYRLFERGSIIMAWNSNTHKLPNEVQKHIKDYEKHMVAAMKSLEAIGSKKLVNKVVERRDDW